MWVIFKSVQLRVEMFVRDGDELDLFFTAGASAAAAPNETGENCYQKKIKKKPTTYKSVVTHVFWLSTGSNRHHHHHQHHHHESFLFHNSSTVMANPHWLLKRNKLREKKGWSF